MANHTEICPECNERVSELGALPRADTGTYLRIRIMEYWLIREHPCNPRKRLKAGTIPIAEISPATVLRAGVPKLGRPCGPSLRWQSGTA